MLSRIKLKQEGTRMISILKTLERMIPKDIKHNTMCVTLRKCILSSFVNGFSGDSSGQKMQILIAEKDAATRNGISRLTDKDTRINIVLISNEIVVIIPQEVSVDA